MVVEGDGRHLDTQNFHSLKDKLNLSMSFDPKRMVCVTCPDEHVVLGCENKPVCIVLSDHNFSPCVLASRGESSQRRGCWPTWTTSLGMCSGTSPDLSAACPKAVWSC